MLRWTMKASLMSAILTNIQARRCQARCHLWLLDELWLTLESPVWAVETPSSDKTLVCSAILSPRFQLGAKFLSSIQSSET